MTLDDLYLYRAETKERLKIVAVAYNQANTKRREIEARYVLDGKSKPKAEALFIIEHKEDWDNYQLCKEELIKAESDEEKANKTYYHARNDQNKGDLIDSQITKLLEGGF